MRWWLDRGVDGFRMDVINMISKDPRAARRRVAGRRRRTATATAVDFVDGPRIHEFLHEMHREVFAGRDGTLLTVGEMPGVTVEEARLFTDPARARGRHGVPVRARRARPRRRRSGTSRPLRLRDLKASLGRWQAGLAERRLEQPLLEQPRPAAGGLPVRRRRRSTGSRSAKMLGTVLHLHRGTPYVYQGEELGMTNAPVRAHRDFRDIESVNHYRDAVAARRGRRRRAAPALRRDEPRQRAHPDAVGRPARTPASPPGRRGSRSTRTTSRSTPTPRVPTPTRSSTTTAG